MDRALYTALSGATRVMTEQQVRSNNMANLSTDGFKADYINAMAVSVEGDGFDTRIHSRNGEQWTDKSAGRLEYTGRELDVAIEGDGWFTLMDEQGNETFTRDGAFHVDAEGVLRGKNNLMVSGDGAPVVLPPYEKLEVGADGRISVRPAGANQGQIVEIGVLKLVNPDPADLSKREDGLFRLPQDAAGELDPEVTMVSGYLEGSNVNAVREMVSFISLSRNFEMQLKMMQSTEVVAEAGDQLLKG